MSTTRTTRTPPTAATEATEATEATTTAAHTPRITSLRQRLMLYLSAGLLAAWLGGSALSIALALHELNEAADTQMSTLARSLMQWPPPAAHNATAGGQLPTIADTFGAHSGSAEDAHHGIALWDDAGRLLLADRAGLALTLQTRTGFENTGPPWARTSWRVLYLHDARSGHTVAVAQQWSERLSTLWSLIGGPLLITLLALPLLLWLLARAVRQGLQPLERLAHELAQRQADNLTPVSEHVPNEALPLVRALNHLFARVGAGIAREQRFTADAAHELRSPLAALRVHTDILAQAEDDAQRQHHAGQAAHSLHRMEHLINQLLALARLDPEQALHQAQPIDWLAVSEQALQSVSLLAREKRVRLQRSLPADGQAPLPLQGEPALLQLLLRNLLDNAIRYAPAHTQVSLQLLPDALLVCDQGPGIAPEHLARITERFYRPAGQNESGSGLGLSIVERIAQLHGLRLSLSNLPNGGLQAKIHLANA